MSISKNLAFAALAVSFAVSSAPAFAGNPCGNAPKPAPPRAAPAPAKGAPAEPVMEKEAKPVRPPVPPSDKPAVELDGLRWMGATWKCVGKMVDPLTGEEMESKATIKAKWDLDKHWLVWEHSRPKSKMMKAIVSKGILGWDSGNKKVLMSGVDNTGSLFAMWGTQNGDVLALEGDGAMMGMKMKTRFTFTRKSDKEHTEVFEIQQGKEWKKVSEETCKR